MPVLYLRLLYVRSPNSYSVNTILEMKELIPSQQLIAVMERCELIRDLSLYWLIEAGDLPKMTNATFQILLLS